MEFDEPSFKLRATKSIEELDFTESRFDHSSRYKNQSYPERPKLRPALSLAQLCDTDDVVSPNRLIAQFECMIQKTSKAA